MITIPKAGEIDVADAPEITSIEFIKQVVNNIYSQLSVIEDEIGTASKQNSTMPEIAVLYDHLHEISFRSEQAILVISDVILDPSKAENAHTIVKEPSKTFSNLRKLMISVKELEQELKEGEYDYYRVIAELLTEVQKQMSSFEQYSATPQVSLIKAKILAIETELRRQVQWSFREIGQLTNSEGYGQDSANEVAVDLSSLSQVYCLVDALGLKFRKDLLERFAQLQLIPYEKLFKLGTKYAGLEHLDRRYAWFKYLLSVVDQRLSDIFPSSWKVSYHLFTEFSRRTKKHIADVLAQTEKENPEANAHVSFMLTALRSVISFEAEIKASFGIRDRAGGEDSAKVMSLESIAEAFDPYLGPYVQLEREGLEKLMEEVTKEEEQSMSAPLPAANGEGDKVQYKLNDPFESSLRMFEYIKNSLKRCFGFSTGITLLSLSKEFRICLQQYAESLKFRCPSPVGMSKSGKVPIYKIGRRMENNLCRIIRTGEYCIDTIPALEAMMKQKINPIYVNEVDFQGQIESFMDMVSFTTGVLVSAEIQRMDADFQTMRDIKWGSIDTVGDVGSYVKHMTKILGDCIPRIRLTMSSTFFLTVCNRFVTAFCDAFLDNIYQLRRISKTGGGQLLLDLNELKEFLLKMPNVNLPEDTEPITITKSYTMVVTKKANKIEIVLKLVCTEDALLEEMFGLLWPEGTKADLDAILTLKGKQLLPINSVVLDQIEDKTKNVLKNTTQTVGKIGKSGVSAAGEITSGVTTGVNKVAGGIKNAFGDISAVVTGGSLFDSSSTHSTGSDDHHQNGGNGSSGFKHAMSNMNAVFAFKSNANPVPGKHQSTSKPPNTTNIKK